MRHLGVVALALALSSCATLQQEQAVSCGGQQSYEAGFSAAAKGHDYDASFVEECSKETRALALRRYMEGYEAGLPKTQDKEEKLSESTKPSEGRVIQTIPSNSWICEVEASAKIFTGVGHSQEEALLSAQKSCGSHFRASFCTRSECKKSL